MKLARRKALLARCRDMKRSGPLGKLSVATLHDRARHNREVPTARRVGTAVHADFLAHVMFVPLAMRADRTFRPAGSFKPCAGGGFAVKVGFCELVFGHGSNGQFTSICVLWCQLRNLRLSLLLSAISQAPGFGLPPSVRPLCSTLMLMPLICTGWGAAAAMSGFGIL